MPLELTAKYDDYSIITSTTKKGTVIEIMVDNEDVDKVLNRGYKYLQLANTNQSKPTLYGVFPNRKLENLKSIIIGKSDNIAHRDGNKYNYRKNNLVEYNIDRNKDQYNHEIKIKGDYALIKVSNPNSQKYKNFEFVVDTDQTLKPFKRFGIKNEGGNTLLIQFAKVYHLQQNTPFSYGSSFTLRFVSTVILEKCVHQN
ncbi:hypothetical protein ACTWQB_15630 [Piscibacillus sp. B03]|uniref:hypothetical protein n=1 Tax=Piscibacillus sp. B03 TaxID=3457430 RepID=UPI003FCEC458